MNSLTRTLNAFALATLRNAPRPLTASQPNLGSALIHGPVPAAACTCLASARLARQLTTGPPAPPSPRSSDPHAQSKPAAPDESGPVSGPSAAPKRPVPIEILEDDLEEKFIRGGGNGGQKVNKTSNCVVLTHLPSGIQVRCHATRSLTDNRRIARKLLKQRLDDHVNGPLSKRALKEAEERRRKVKRQQKNKKGPSAAGGKKGKEAGETGGGNVAETGGVIVSGSSGC